MKRTVVGLMVLVGWVIVPSVAIWLLGGPLWAWVAVIGGIGGALLVLLCCIALFEFIADKYGRDVVALCVLLPLCLVALTQALGYPWWVSLASLGVLAAIPVGLVGFKWLIDE